MSSTPPTGDVDNDTTIELYAELAVVQAAAGADVIAPSGMMDGQVGAIRAALDSAGHPSTAVLAYAAKYASALYGPFREAADVTIVGGGDRTGYQQDPRNGREALAEVIGDVAEGADMVMVKPALTYLDVVAEVRRVGGRTRGRLSRERGVRHGQGGGRAGLDRRPGGGPGADHRHPSGRCRLRPDLLRRRAGRGARCLSARRLPAPRSEDLFVRAERVHPGGVNSPVRSFRSVGGHPYFVSRGEGAYVWDADGNKLLDFVQSYGASILGHADPEVVTTLRTAAGRGSTFGAPTEGEVLLAEAICATGARVRPGPPGVVGHRGHHECHPGGAGLHPS